MRRHPTLRVARLSLVILVASFSAVQAEPPTPDLGASGLDALDAGDFQRAYTLLERATQENPEDPFLQYGLGIAAVQLAEDVVAVRALQRAAA